MTFVSATAHRNELSEEISIYTANNFENDRF